MKLEVLKVALRAARNDEREWILERVEQEVVALGKRGRKLTTYEVLDVVRKIRNEGGA